MKKKPNIPLAIFQGLRFAIISFIIIALVIFIIAIFLPFLLAGPYDQFWLDIKYGHCTYESIWARIYFNILQWLAFG